MPYLPSAGGRKWAIPALLAALTCAIALYGFTRAFVWDEGFHLLAAQLILDGKRPYLDFCFPQTPLNAYWNAAWMRLFGQAWRVSHIPSTLEIAAALVLLWRYLRSRLPAGEWQTPTLLIALLLFGANSSVFLFGPIAQAYAICMLAGIASFILVAGGVDSEGIGSSFWGGLCIGIGAASSLLIAPAALVFLAWLCKYNTCGSRNAKTAAFVVGAAIPFAPVFWLFAQNPHVVFFNIVQYQAIFRRADWAGWLAVTHDVDVLSSWIDDGQTLLLLLLCLASILRMKHRPPVATRFRREFWLAVATSAALALYISTAHPTFTRYYVVGMPIFAIVAAPGFRAAASRLAGLDRPFWPTLVLASLLVIGLGRTLFDDRDASTWSHYQEVASEVVKVTPPSALLFADEHVYFLLRRLPPPGLEFSYSHKVDLPAKEAAALHIIPAKTLDRRMKSGYYATVESCDDDKIDSWGLADHYKNRKDVGDCSIFWNYASK